jgi:glycosyltransferase involved in cell wall biosynthesis
MTDTSVSVIIPAYRAERTIRRAIDSALAQTVPPTEILVVDDGSPHPLAPCLADYDHRVRVIRQANARAASARNTGIEQATGEFIAFLDADDYWELDKLERQLEIFRTHSELGMVAGRYYTEQPGAVRTLAAIRVDNNHDRVLRVRSSQAFHLGTRVWTSVVLIRRSFLGKERFVSGLEPAEDRDLWIRLASRGSLYLMSDPLATAVLEPHSLSRGNVATDCECMLEVINRHRRLLGLVGTLHWRAYVRYRWAAMEPIPYHAIAHLARSFCTWPAPFVGMPTMQSMGRLRRLAVVMRALMFPMLFTDRTAR